MTAATVEVPLVSPDSQMPLTGGDVTTSFAFALPAGASCPADSALGGFRVNSFMVPATADLAHVRFDAFGPREGFPLFDKGRPFVNANTAMRTGVVVGLPPFDLATLVGVPVPEGVYRVGIACTAEGAMRTAWWTRIAVSSTSGDHPSITSWSVVTGTQMSGAGVPAVQSSVVATTTALAVQPTSSSTVAQIGVDGPVVVQPVVADVVSVAIPVVPDVAHPTSGTAWVWAVVLAAVAFAVLAGWRARARRRTA